MLITPDFYCPWPERIHPQAQEIQDSCNAFLDTFRLYATDEQRDRIRRTYNGIVAARNCPEAPAEWVKILADWYVWAFCYDDEYCDEAPTGSDPAAMALINLGFRRSADITEYPTAPDNTYAMALRDIRMRIDQHLGPAEGENFSLWLRSYLGAELAVAGLRATGRRPSLNEYVVIRLDSGGGNVFPHLIHAINCAGTPRACWTDRDVQVIREIVAFVVTWDSDIYSFAKESVRSNNGSNAVWVLMEEKGLSEQDALREAQEIRDACVSLMIRISGEVEKRSPELARYVWSQQVYMRGCNDWAFSVTERYGYTGPGDGVELKRPALTDVPASEGLEPVGIPALDWWWHHDPLRK